jgi:hypothetical protein
VVVDASYVGLGTILVQAQDKETQVTTFATQALNEAQNKCWPFLEISALASV